MSKNKRWIITFCYKIHEKLKSHSQRLSQTDLDIYFRLRQSPEVLNGSSGGIVKKIKKEQVRLNLYKLLCYEEF